MLLAEDHRRARELADALGALPGVSAEAPHTNLVFTTVPADAGKPLAEFLLAQGVRIAGTGPRIRLVTHLDIDDEGLARAIAAFRAFFAGR